MAFKAPQSGIQILFCKIVNYQILSIIIVCISMISIPSITNAGTIDIPYVKLMSDKYPEKLKTYCEKYADDCTEIFSKSSLNPKDISFLRNNYNSSSLTFFNKNELLTAKQLSDPTSLSPTQVISTQSFQSLEEKFINGLAEFIVTRAKAEAAYFFQSEMKKSLCDTTEEFGKYSKYFPNLCSAFDASDLSLSLNSMGSFLHAAAKKDLENMPDVFLRNVVEIYVDKEKEKFKKDVLKFIADDKEVINKIDAEEWIKVKLNELTAANIIKSRKELTIDQIIDFLIAVDLNEKDEIIKDRKVIVNYLKEQVKEKLNIIGKEKEYAEVLNAVRVVLAIYHESRDGRSALDLIRGLSVLDTQDCESENGGDTLKYIRAGALFVRAVERNIIEFDGKIRTIDDRYVALGIIFTFERLLKENKNLYFGSTYNFNQFDDEQIISFFDFLTSTSNVLEKVREIKSLSDEILMPVKDKDDEIVDNPKLRLSTRLKAINNVLYLTERMSDEIFLKLGDVSTPNTKYIKFKENLQRVHTSLEFAREVMNGNESALMVSFLSYVSQIERDFGGKYHWFPDNVKRAIPVLTEITKAESSADIAKVLETAAAPVGSYRQKAKRRMTSITAFLGPSLEQEHYDNNKSAKLNAFASIGIHASWTALKKEYFNNFGIYLSLIDLGPLVSTREGDGVKSESNVGFKQAFSPGIFGTLHLFGPVNFGIGASKTPGLAEKTTGGEISVWRIQGFFAVDLTLFPF